MSKNRFTIVKKYIIEEDEKVQILDDGIVWDEFESKEEALSRVRNYIHLEETRIILALSDLGEQQEMINGLHDLLTIEASIQ